jgi:hypothetical protein
MRRIGATMSMKLEQAERLLARQSVTSQKVDLDG